MNEKMNAGIGRFRQKVLAFMRKKMENWELLMMKRKSMKMKRNMKTMTNMMMIMKKSPREASFIKTPKTMIKISMKTMKTITQHL